MESAGLVTHKSSIAVTALRLELFHSHEAGLGILCVKSDRVGTRYCCFSLVTALLNGRSRNRFLSVTAYFYPPKELHLLHTSKLFPVIIGS